MLILHSPHSQRPIGVSGIIPWPVVFVLRFQQRACEKEHFAMRDRVPVAFIQEKANPVLRASGWAARESGWAW